MSLMKRRSFFGALAATAAAVVSKRATAEPDGGKLMLPGGDSAPTTGDFRLLNFAVRSRGASGNLIVRSDKSDEVKIGDVTGSYISTTRDGGCVHVKDGIKYRITAQECTGNKHSANTHACRPAQGVRSSRKRWESRQPQ